MHEIKNDANGIQFLVVEGVPVSNPATGDDYGMHSGNGAVPYGVRVGAPISDQMQR